MPVMTTSLLIGRSQGGSSEKNLFLMIYLQRSGIRIRASLASFFGNKS
jgi:hypothetical protein